MSKLEEAIRKASLRHEKIRLRRSDESTDEQAAGNDDTLNRLAPVLYRLQPACRHIPSVRALEKHRIINDGYSEDALTSYKMLRTRILQEYDAREWKTLAVTSPHDGDGKTVTAINLAITLASQGGHEIFLVDLDLRNPSIADYFGLPAEMAGIGAYLDRNVDLSSILWNVGVENLAVLGSRDRFADSSERITSKRMQELIKTFKKASPKPIVIFDLPPVLTADDAVAISPYMDGVLMVASERETRREDLSHAMDMLQGAQGTTVLGVVLNKVGRH